MSHPTLISHILHKASKRIFAGHKGKSRLSMPRLLERWAEIIAPDDASTIVPSYVTWKKTGDDVNKSSAGTLHVKVPSAVAAKLMYREKIIIERINRIFGLPANACLHRMAVTHAAQSARKLTPKPQPRDVDADTAERLANIEDPVLRERLASLARSMASKNLP